MGLVPTVAFLAVVVTAQPVLADCTRTVAAFPPGHWVAQGITVRGERMDRRSTTVVEGTGGFDLTVDELGAASGTLSIAGEAYSQSWVEGDDTSTEATYIKSGDLTGTASLIQVDGEIDLQMSGAIDVAPTKEGDPIRPSGDDMIGYENAITVPWTAQFSPTSANCNQVFGSLDGQVDEDKEYDGNESFFLAVRVGAADPAGLDIQGQLAELLEQAQTVLNMEPVDTDVLGEFVRDMLQFESLLASLESCDAGDENLEIGPTWAMLQSVMLNTMRVYMNAAESGAYPTAHVVGAMTVWIQGGSLGWRADECLDDSSASDGVVDVYLKFEEVLLKRLLALQAVDVDLPLDETGPEADAAAAESKLIAVAAYQFGLPRVIDALHGRPS